jgi:hypothetical protein
MTRLVYEHFMSKDKLLNLTFTTSLSKNLMTNVHFDFMGPRKRWLTIGGVAFLICIGFMAIRGLSRSIDFTGGRNFNVQFENAVEPEDVRSLVANSFEDANVSVIAVGTDGRTVRISTNYRINEDGQNVDTEIESRLYEALKPLLTQNISLDTFIDRDNYQGGSIISSQKVGPSIAEDITYSAIWSVILALIAIGIYILVRFYNIAYSIGATGALILDTSIILGAYAIREVFVTEQLQYPANLFLINHFANLSKTYDTFKCKPPLIFKSNTLIHNTKGYLVMSGDAVYLMALQGTVEIDVSIIINIIQWDGIRIFLISKNSQYSSR